MRCNMLPRMTAVLVALAVAGLVATTASARSSAVPAQTSEPTLQGPAAQPFVGDKLTTTNGGFSIQAVAPTFLLEIPPARSWPPACPTW